MPDSLATRLQRLQDTEAIKEMRHRYWRAFDAGMPELCRACHTDDTSCSYLDGKYVHSNLDSLMAFIGPGLNNARKRVATTLGYHYFIHPEITVTSETVAKGKWLMRYVTFDTANKKGTDAGVYFDEEYLKVGDSWKISKLLSRTLFNASFPLTNLQAPRGKFAYQGGPDDAAFHLPAAPRTRSGEARLAPLGSGTGETRLASPSDALAALEDREAIRQLKHAYSRALDSSLWDEFRSLHTPEATTNWVDGLQQFKRPDEMLASLQRNFTNERHRAGILGLHMVVEPEIDLLSPTAARAHWLMNYPTYNVPEQRGGHLIVMYKDDLLKLNGHWKIKHSITQTLFSAQLPLPGLQVTNGPAAYTGGPGDIAQPIAL